jgi:hypothetical protein
MAHTFPLLEIADIITDTTDTLVESTHTSNIKDNTVTRSNKIVTPLRNTDRSSHETDIPIDSVDTLYDKIASRSQQNPERKRRMLLGNPITLLANIDTCVPHADPLLDTTDLISHNNGKLADHTSRPF